MKPRTCLLALVVGVAAWAAGRIEVFRWKEFGVAVGGVDAYLPLVVVDDAVVVAAEQNGVGEFSGPAVGPVADVVSVAPAGGSVAAGEGAASVAQDEGSADGAGEQASLPTQVEDLSLAAQHGRQDSGVAGQPTGCGRGELPAVVQLSDSGRPTRSSHAHCVN